MAWEILPIEVDCLPHHATLVPSGIIGQVLLKAQSEPNGRKNFSSASLPSFSETPYSKLYDVYTRNLLCQPSIQLDKNKTFKQDSVPNIGNQPNNVEVGKVLESIFNQPSGQTQMLKVCWIYNYEKREWMKVTDFNFQTGKIIGEGRWYSAILTLPNGDIIAMSGRLNSKSPSLQDANMPKRYSYATFRWQHLPEAPPVNFFAKMHLITGGLIFLCAPVSENNSTSLPDGPEISRSGDEKTGDAPHAWDQPSILLPLLPGDGFKSRILMCDSLQPVKVEFDHSSAGSIPSWSDAGSWAGKSSDSIRISAGALYLPNGKIFLPGVIETCKNGSTVACSSEIYEPGIDWSSYTYSNSQSWTTVAQHEAVVPLLPCFALLLPDGSVWTIVSEKNNIDGDCSSEKAKIAIYKPEYFNNPSRPVIASAPESIGYHNGTFQITSPQASTIQRVVITKNGSVTQHGDLDCRYIALQFSHIPKTEILEVQYPNDASILTPGNYLLWIIDNMGLPCKLGRFIRIAHQSSSIEIARNTFSVHELESLLTTSHSASFPGLFHVVYDGFLPTEIGNSTTPPAITFHLDNPEGRVTQDLDVTLRQISYENPELPASIPQKIKFIFDLHFKNNRMFSSLQDDRNIVIKAVMGAHKCEIPVVLKKNPLPLANKDQTASIYSPASSPKSGSEIRWPGSIRKITQKFSLSW